jgi:hypothetical protein
MIVEVDATATHIKLSTAPSHLESANHPHANGSFHCLKAPLIAAPGGKSLAQEEATILMSSLKKPYFKATELHLARFPGLGLAHLCSCPQSHLGAPDAPGPPCPMRLLRDEAVLLVPRAQKCLPTLPARLLLPPLQHRTSRHHDIACFLPMQSWPRYLPHHKVQTKTQGQVFTSPQVSHLCFDGLRPI